MKEVGFGLSVKNVQDWDIRKDISSEWCSEVNNANVGKRWSEGNKENHLPEER